MYRLLAFILLFLFAETSPAQNININNIRNQFNQQYDSGHFNQALVKVDAIITYWKNLDERDSTDFYRYRRAHTMGSDGRPTEAVKESSELISERESTPPLPDFMGRLYFTNGMNRFYLSEFEKATEILNKSIAFETNRSIPDTSTIANAIEWKGIVCAYTDHLEDAQNLVEQALNLRYAIYDSSSIEIAYSLNSLAGIYNERNMLAETARAYKEAYRILKLRLPSGHPNLLSVAANLSNVESGMGDISDALKLLETAIAGHEKLNSAYNLMQEYHNLGSIYATSLHDDERARVYFLKSLNLADSLLPKPHFYRASIYDGLGGTYLEQGNYLRADSFFVLSYDERMSMPEKTESDLGQSSYNLGLTSEANEDTARAIIYFTRSLNYYSASFGENHPKTANAMFELANLNWLNGNREEALRSFRKCLKIYTQNLTSHHAYPLQTDIKLAECFGEINQPDSTELYLRKAWEGVCETDGKPVKLKSLSEYPIAFVDPEVLNLINLNLDILIKRRELIGENDNREGVELMKTMDKLMAQLWPMLNFDNETSSLLPKIKTIYRKGVLLTSLNKAVDHQVKMLCLNSLEQSQSASIRSALQNRNAMHYANVPDSIVEKDRKLREKLRFVQANAKDGEIEVSDDISFRTLNEWRTFQQELQKQYPEWYSARYAPETPNLGEVQKTLSEVKASLAAYFVEDTSLVILLVDGKNFETYISSLPPTWRDSMRTYRSLTEKRADAKRLAPLSYYLYTLFWKPIEAKVQYRVMLIPDGALNFLNFETLISSMPESNNFSTWDWLIKKHIFLYRNSLPGKTEASVPNENEILALAPGFSDELKAEYQNRLGKDQAIDSTFTHWVQTPWSVSFAEELKPKGKTFVGLEATKAAFRENASHAEILHFGTHAQLQDTDPLTSYLALTPQPEKADGGYLFAYELYNQPLRAQLAVLTACETGLGTYREGDGVISIAHAFQYAGCPNVIYSLWQIDDKQSTALVKQFYAYLDENDSFSEALHHAKLDYIANNSDELNAPYYWGGMVLTGSDGKLSEKNSFGLKYGWLLALVIAIVIVLKFRKREKRKSNNVF